jgi:hypothetical protein
MCTLETVYRNVPSLKHARNLDIVFFPISERGFSSIVVFVHHVQSSNSEISEKNIFHVLFTFLLIAVLHLLQK